MENIWISCNLIVVGRSIDLLTCCTLSLQGVNEEVVCKNHLILGQHLFKDLEGQDFTLYGGAKFRSKDNKVTPTFSSVHSKVED